jgi:hypothetical protein
VTKRSLSSKIKKHGQTSDEVLNTLTDLIGLAAKGWDIAHGPEESGRMVATLIAQFAARYAITSLMPTAVIKDIHQMALNAMLLYCDDIERQMGTSKDMLRQELMHVGAQYPKLEVH